MLPFLQNYELINDSNELFAYATLPDDNAMNEANNNIYVNKYKDKVLENFKIELQVIGKNMDYKISCTCEEPSWYMLYTDYSLIESPVVCGDCGKEVPLYKLPHIQGYKEHFGVVSWQEAYSSIDRLWVYCLSDRFTLRQMHDPDSQLSIDGKNYT